jgi:hypothetical protein
MNFDTPSSDNLTNSIKLFGGNLHLDGKEDNSYSSNKIYIVAGERNIKAVNINGGLYANVGQTTRRITDRLSDDDYKRKAGGGRWIPLLEYSVGNSISDKEIHIHLRQHPDVRWDRESNNTEEFLFRNDLGDGVVAKEIVLGILKKICLPMIQKENTLLLKKNEAITKELNEANEKIEEMLSEDYIQSLVNKVEMLELNLTVEKSAVSNLNGIVRKREETIRNNEGRIVGQERRFTEKSAVVTELEKKVNSAETKVLFLTVSSICVIFVFCLLSLFAYNNVGSNKSDDNIVNNLETELARHKVKNEELAEQIRVLEKEADVVSEEKNKVSKDQPKSVSAAESTIECVSIEYLNDGGRFYINCKTESEVLRLYGNFYDILSGTKVKISKLGGSYIAKYTFYSIEREVVVTITDGSGNRKKLL